jgi:hypothetical protein
VACANHAPFVFVSHSVSIALVGLAAG